MKRSFGETYKQITDIKSAFHHMDEMMMKLTVMLICPKLK